MPISPDNTTAVPGASGLPRVPGVPAASSGTPEPEQPQTRPPSVPQHISKLQFQDGTAVNLTPEEMDALLRIQEMVGLPKDRIAFNKIQIEKILVCGKTLQSPFAALPVGPFTIEASEKLLFSAKALHIFPIPSGAAKVHFPLEQHLMAFQGVQTPLPTTTSIAQGTVGLTNRRFLFASPDKNLSIDFDSISMLDMFSEVIGIFSTREPRKSYFVVENPPLVLLIMNQIFQSQ